MVARASSSFSRAALVYTHIWCLAPKPVKENAYKILLLGRSLPAVGGAGSESIGGCAIGWLEFRPVASGGVGRCRKLVVHRHSLLPILDSSTACRKIMY
ncbi:hypothetical protein EVAR_65128_1 [Eumeta japonica]|uniref:Uncharacterized protein n=1 Tax=Eumeta variegata TaxID=151549 RepID=A0A4C1Z835_EUMVA|nr:hypothetical protein EVAR_65128_1 [Eumeta japonica]